MRIAKLLLLPTILAVVVSFGFGQSSKTIKPDLTGTWELQTRAPGSPEQIKITHHDPELTIRRLVYINGVREERDLTYYTDGRGERNPAIARYLGSDGAYMESWRPAEITSNTTWSKAKVVTHSVDWSFGSAAVFEYEITDEWWLSKNGKTLTITRRAAPNKDLTGNAAMAFGDDLKEVYKLISK